jgi:hypothetical protein
MSILIATVLDYTQAEHELDVFKAWLARLIHPTGAQ